MDVLNKYNLNNEKIKSSLLINFFPENISKEIFSTKYIIKYITSEIISKINNQIKGTPCFDFSIYKSEKERRLLNIPHISNYLLLVDYIEKNIKFIYSKIQNNNFSHSKNIFLPYEKNTEFNESVKKKVLNSIGNKYILSLDISRCYESIYTHSITWALLGKKTAKSEYLKKTDKNNEYKIADNLDKRVRSINNNETKGIPTGPITSRLISELILSEIDSILHTKFPNLKYNRFVDDYSFYFLEKNEAILFISKFQKILYDFKFSLNESKTKIELFPNGIFTVDLSSELGNYDFKKNTIISFIKKVMFLHNSGVKGAFKYGIKVLSSQKIKDEDKEYTCACLINSLTIFPMTSDVIINIFAKNNLLNLGNEKQINDIINKLLEKNIENNYDEEIFWNLCFLMKFNLEVEVENILKLLRKMETFTSIMILDYIFKKNLHKNENDIKNELENLKNILCEEDVYSEKWLFLYECCKNNWIKGLRKTIKEDQFLKKLLENNIGFYISPLKG